MTRRSDRKPERPADPPATIEIADAIDAPLRRVLIVDRDRDVVDRLAALLAANGYAVATAYGTDEARLKTRQSRPEIAILDVGLGSGNGLDLIAWLRLENPNMACVLTAEYDEIETAITAELSGNCGYLRKPLHDREVLAALAGPRAIDIHSEPGHGTRVRIHMPRAVTADDVVKHDDSTDKAPERSADTILVVEDDPDVRDLAVNLLESLNYRTVAAECGRRALAILDHETDVDLLFTDVVLPGGMSGAALAVEAQRRRPDLKVLYTSGYAEDLIVHDGRLDVGIALLQKPYRKADLARKLEAVLGGEQRRLPAKSGPRRNTRRCPRDRTGRF